MLDQENKQEELTTAQRAERYLTRIAVSDAEYQQERKDHDETNKEG